jgi:hypothetical protein
MRKRKGMSVEEATIPQSARSLPELVFEREY